jgi:hypothetical protein
MSSAHAIHHGAGDGLERGVLTEREASDRAGRRLTLVLFAGLIALAIVGVSTSVVANSMIVHRYPVAPSAAVTPAARQISLYVAPGWKPGPGGERHDAFSKTNFNVKVGQTLRMTIDNRDTAIHSITSAEAGVNIVITPGVHTYTLVVHQAGHFKWVCAYECDPFSMTHIGYMQGYITAT